MSMQEKPVYDSSKMEYRYLGNSGLRVSVLSFGVMLHDLKELLKKCLKNGINFFDTEEVYGMGVAEKTFGQTLIELNIPREKIIVSIRNDNGPNDAGEGRKHIIEGVKQSL